MRTSKFTPRHSSLLRCIHTETLTNAFTPTQHHSGGAGGGGGGQAAHLNGFGGGGEGLGASTTNALEGPKSTQSTTALGLCTRVWGGVNNRRKLVPEKAVLSRVRHNSIT